MGRTTQLSAMRFAVLVVAASIVFGLDLAIPVVVVQVLYIPLLILAARYLSFRAAWFYFAMCAVLAVYALEWESHLPADRPLWKQVANEFISVAAGASVTVLALSRFRYANELRNTCNYLRLSDRQLRHSEALYRALVDTLPQCVFRKDLAGRYTYANPRFCEYVGRSVDQVIGATDFDHCPPHLASKYRADDCRVVECGMPLEIIEDLQMPDGNICQLQTVKTPVLDSQGRVIGTQGIFWDITEKLRAEQALGRSEHQFRTLAENLPDIVARFDRQFRHIYVNRAVQKITRRPVEDFLGKTNAELNMPEHLVRLWHDSIQAVFDSAAEQAIEFSYDGQHGLRHFECRMIPESAPDGSVETILAICRDVTERICAQEQEQLHLTQLAHATRLSMIGGLVSEIAHEINQPLHAIVNFSQAGINVLEKTPASQRPNLFNWLNQISEQANRAAEIIRNAGRFVRKAPYRRAKLNLNGLVRDSLPLVHFDLRMHCVILRCEFDDDLPLVLADAVQIQQVLMNLLRNAMEAVAERPEDSRNLLVRTTAVGGGLQVSVHDNGRGLSLENLEKVFEPFFTTKSEGIGLGLAVCRSIIQSHQGRLWAQNNPDQGVTFYFTLPAVREEPHHVYCHA